MLKPRAIEPGARLAVVAPASPFDRREFDEGLAEIRRLGFVPIYDESVFAQERYLAGRADVRAAALRAAWQNPDIDGIVAVRGGFGSAQTLALLDPAEVRRGCKPFLGHSDLTALLMFHVQCCQMVAFHGPMVAGGLAQGSAGYDRDSLVRTLCRREPVGELAATGLERVRGGEARGMLTGGTLTQLLASLSTPFAFDPPQGHVLFLDEVGERPYRLDRMVTQLGQSGCLGRASAVVIGELPRCDEPDGELTGRAVMADLLADFPGPVLMRFPSGHTHGPTMTLPFGVQVRVLGGGAGAGRPRLVIEESAVQ